MVRRLDHRGSSAVEFALILPLLTLLLFGIIEFGILLYNKQVITNASREGARAGIAWASPRPTPSDIKSVVDGYSKSHLLTFASSDPGPSTAVPNGTCSGFGQSLDVTVTYQYQFLVFSSVLRLVGPDVLGNSLTLTAQTIMKCE